MKLTNELERELIEKAQQQLHEKVERGEFNGDAQENILLVLLSINRRVGVICSNPLVILGDFFQRYPKLAWVTGLVLWVLLGAGSLAVILGFLATAGLEITQIVP